MPAWQPEWLGVKIVTVHPANVARGHDAVHSTYMLARAETGEPVAIIDGDTLTARRTAAASALASSFLSRPDSSRLLVLGAGRVASLLPAAHRTTRPITEVLLWNRGPARRDTLAARLRADGFTVRLIDDLVEAVAAADIVSTATLASAPLIEGRWLRPGTHVDLMGAFTPQMREADDEALARAAVYADTEAALAECGELAGWTPDRLHGTLAHLCRGQPGRTDAGAITLFKSVGTALEDLAAAVLATGVAIP